MSARIHVRANQLIATDVTVSDSYVTERVDMQLMEGVAFQVNWKDGTDIVGELSVECSVDGVTYCTFVGSSTSISGITGGQIFDIVETHVRYIRIKIDGFSGSSIFNVRMNLRTREM